MFGSETLEVAIGVIFVYILVSLLCSAIREGIEALLKTRAAYLEYGIREVLHDVEARGLARSFYNHPLIYSLFHGQYEPDPLRRRPALLARGKTLPSYIPTHNFAIALLDIAARGPVTDVVSSDPHAPALSLDSVRANITNIRNPAVQRILLSAIDTAQGDLNRAIANVEAWYDTAMDRVSGWYKRSTQIIIFCIALVVAVGLNINTITIADYLYRNDAARSVVIKEAEKLASNETARLTATEPSTGETEADARKRVEEASRRVNDTVKSLDALNLPIGWSQASGAPWIGSERGAGALLRTILIAILGWLMTAFASTMGAPFWFDMLNRVMVIRSTVKPHEKSPEEASEDRQASPKREVTEEIVVASAGPTGEAPTPSPESEASPRDEDSDKDGCDVEMDTPAGATSDEDLPAAEGGVE